MFRFLSRTWLKDRRGWISLSLGIQDKTTKISNRHLKWEHSWILESIQKVIIVQQQYRVLYHLVKQHQTRQWAERTQCSAMQSLVESNSIQRNKVSQEQSQVWAQEWDQMPVFSTQMRKQIQRISISWTHTRTKQSKTTTREVRINKWFPEMKILEQALKMKIGFKWETSWHLRQFKITSLRGRIHLVLMVKLLISTNISSRLKYKHKEAFHFVNHQWLQAQSYQDKAPNLVQDPDRAHLSKAVMEQSQELHQKIYWKSSICKQT